jgi:hypothetical protein
MPGLLCRGIFVAKRGLIQPCLPPQKTGTEVVIKIKLYFLFFVLKQRKEAKENSRL